MALYDFFDSRTTEEREIHNKLKDDNFELV
jgi:hypothetical protein